MTEVEAFAELKEMCAAETHPRLADETLTRLVRKWKRYETWDAGKTIGFGDKYAPSAGKRNGRAYVCVEAGTTALAEPDWNGSRPYQSVRDGGVLWMDDGPAPREPFDLGGAAQEAWQKKAALAATEIATSYGDEKEQASERFKHCLQMAALFAPAYVV